MSDKSQSTDDGESPEIIRVAIENKANDIRVIEETISQLEDEEVAITVIKEEYTIQLTGLKNSLKRLQSLDESMISASGSRGSAENPSTNGAKCGSSSSSSSRGNPALTLSDLKRSDPAQPVEMLSASEGGDVSSDAKSNTAIRTVRGTLPTTTKTKPRTPAPGSSSTLLKRLRGKQEAVPIDRPLNKSLRLRKKPRVAGSGTPKPTQRTQSSKKTPDTAVANDSDTESEVQTINKANMKIIKRKLSEHAAKGDAKKMEALIQRMETIMGKDEMEQIVVAPLYGYTPFMRVITYAPESSVAACISLLSPIVRKDIQAYGGRLRFCTRGFTFKTTVIGMAYLMADLDVLNMIVSALEIERIRREHVILQWRNKWTQFINTQEEGSLIRERLLELIEE